MVNMVRYIMHNDINEKRFVFFSTFRSVKEHSLFTTSLCIAYRYVCITWCIKSKYIYVYEVLLAFFYRNVCY